MESIRQHFTPSVNTSAYFSKSLAIGLPVSRTVAYPRRSDSVRVYWTYTYGGRVAHIYLAASFFPTGDAQKLKLPKPEIVSCVQSARLSGFPHDLQPPTSSFANKSSSTIRLRLLPEINTSRKKHFRRFYHFRSAFFYFLSTNFHLFF